MLRIQHGARAVDAALVTFLAFVLQAHAISRKLRSVSEHSQDNIIKKRPNIVWILADDLHFETGIWENMPNLRRMRRDGLEFPNHVSQSPLCGPARASLVIGRLPHNSGYKTNAGEDSIGAYSQLQDSSVGKWLTDAGYYTAFLGKYVNGMIDIRDQTPKGWNYFGGFTGQWDPYKQRWLGGTYTYYDTSQWDLQYDDTGTKLLEKENSDYPIKIWTGVHQADFLASQTLDHAKIGIDKEKPFFIFTNPVMVHHGYCQTPLGPDDDGTTHPLEDPWREQFDETIHRAISPCPKKRESHMEFIQNYAGSWLMHGHTPAWNTTGVGQREPLGSDCCDATDVERQRYGAQNRTGSMVDLDEMIGVILHGLHELRVLDSTYIIFTSDNGFHLGEHKFMFGKTTPYDHDVRVPMVIRTPRSASRGVRNLPTSHIDITRTIVDLAGAADQVPSLEALDGKSFIEAFSDDVKVNDWRAWSYSEMFEMVNKTWRNIRFMDNKGNPAWSLNFWCTGDLEIYLLQDDPHQLYNILAPHATSEQKKLGEEILAEWLPVLHGMGTCVGEKCNKMHLVSKDLEGQDLSELMVCEQAGRRARHADQIKSSKA